MRVELDGSRCQGHGRCQLISPETFDLDEEGFAILLEGDVPPTRSDDVLRAVANCPERAITSS